MTRFLSTPLVLMSTVLAADLPVREVVLYKNGVAYFERAGELKPGEAARLDFKTSEMNDLLKSLTVADAAGGKVTAVRYDSAEPVDRKLAEFAFQVGSNQPLSAFLDRMKGAQITLKYGPETVAGTILAARPIANDHEQLTLLLDSGEFRVLDLSAATNIRFADPAVEKQLKAYLGVLAQSRSTDRRSVYIDSTTTGARKLSASYMIPAPVWKSSYRLILADPNPTLEGWAIVDNTTADDWTNIRLALVSGRPVSFISRLYEPKYRQRPFGDLAEEASVGPRVYAGAVAGAAPMAAPPPPAPGLAMAEMRGSVGLGPARAKATDSALDVSSKRWESSAVVNTAGREVGELFEYGFSTPVTIKRGESAMLPFLQEKVNARKLLIFTAGSDTNPMNAAEITNSTGKTLDGGPITVYDGGAYAGEALVETLKNGDKRLISYAVDLGTRVASNLESSDQIIREIHVNRGILTTRTAEVTKNVYTVKNVDAKAKTLIIEHPVRGGYKLLNAKPIETTPAAYRFEVKLGPNAEVKFPVDEEYVFNQTFEVMNMTPDMLVVYLQNRTLSDAGRRALNAISDRKHDIAVCDSEMERLQSESAEVERDQSRVRQNISSLNSVSGQEQQVRQYSQQLAAGESRIVAMRDQVNQQRIRKQQLQKALNELIEKTVF